MQSGLRSRSRPESVVLTGVGVGVGFGKFSSTPTPARSRSRLQHFFITPFLVKMETEHDVLTADRHDGLTCAVLLSLRLRLFPGELSFNRTSRPDNQNRQRHSLWSLCSCLALSDKFWRGNRLKKSLEHSDFLCCKSYWSGGTAGTVRYFHYTSEFKVDTFDRIVKLLGEKFGHWVHFGPLRGSCPPNLQYEILANFYWTLLSSLPTILCIKALQTRYHCFKTLPFDTWKKRLMWVGVGVRVVVGVGVAEIWSTPQPCL